MFFGYDLKEIFTFPFKDADARKYLLIGGLISLAGFFIPILPYFVLYGYAVIIAKQVLNGESPRMVPWEDWGGMFKDGAKLFGIRMIFSLPIIILAIPLMLGGIAMPFIAEGLNSADAENFVAIFSIIMMGSMCIIIPLSIPLAILIPAAEIHNVDKDDFAAAFRFKEWWSILCANLGGFIIAFGIYYVASMVFATVMQLLFVTIIFACLAFIIIPAMTIYLTLVMYATVAQAYKVGKEKLVQAEQLTQQTT